MGIKEKADQERKEAYQKDIATKILDKITELREKSSSNRRWIWELLQNAKDVAEENLCIEVAVTEESVEFKHNGHPFSIKDLTYLIEQVSSKERLHKKSEAPKTSGKFGTGFMTTYLLSAIVDVSGVLHCTEEEEEEEEEACYYKFFNIRLDRDTADLSQMIQRVDEAYSIFEKLDNDEHYPRLSECQPDQHSDTSFLYSLDKAGVQTAEKGVQDLHNIIHYVFAFVPVIQCVTIIDEIKRKKSAYRVVSRETFGRISFITIKEEAVNDSRKLKQNKNKIIAYISNENQTISLATEVTFSEKSGSYLVKEKSPKVPTLFCDFPLVGTEDFPYPCVINSPLFNPTESRDGIVLNQNNRDVSAQNKEILEQATILYCEMLDEIALKWRGVHLLTGFGSAARVPGNSDEGWYEDQIINPIIEKLLETPVVTIASGEKIALSNAWIPTCEQDNRVKRFSEIVSAVYINCIPEPGQVLHWQRILKSHFWKEFRSKREYTPIKLLAEISEQESLDNVMAFLDKKQLETLDWLNQVISFMTVGYDDLLDEYAVIPNQHQQLTQKKCLRHDLAVPEELKDVLNILGIDARKFLAHQEIDHKFSVGFSIEDAVEKINLTIRDGEHQDQALREAVYTLVSCFPKNEYSTDNVSLTKKREAIWRFARNLDNTVPNKLFLDNWIPSLWEEADLWLLQTLVNDIENMKDVASLSESLDSSDEDSISWLNQFIGFLNLNDCTALYEGKAIFPNQKGSLEEEKSLHFDNNIPEEIKDVLENLNFASRRVLLASGIEYFDGDYDLYTINNISSAIGRKYLDSDETDKGDKFKEVTYALISYFSDTNTGDLVKIKLLEFASQFYPGAVPCQLILPNLEDFTWDACNKWLLKSMFEEITVLEHIDALADHLTLGVDAAIDWLDAFVNFAAEQDQSLLTSHSIFPNQKGLFMEKNGLWKDDAIPEELKDVLAVLTSEHWDDTLLHKGCVHMGAFFDSKATRGLKSIAREIDDAIKDWDTKGRSSDPKFIEAVLHMMSWSQENPKEIDEVFSYFRDRRAHLLLNTIDDTEVSHNTFTILQPQHRGKLGSLAKLAKNSDISTKDIESFADDPKSFRELQVVKIGMSDQQFQELVVLAGKVSVHQIDELMEINHDLRTLQAFQESASGKPDEIYSALEKLGIHRVVEHLYEAEGNQSATRETEFFADQDTRDEIGRRGEEIVYQTLIEAFGADRVVWLNQKNEQFKAYDFTITDSNGAVLYVDAKATKTQPHRANGIPFYVSKQEWDFSGEADHYYIARVFNVWDDATVRFLKFVRLDEASD